LYVSDVVAVLQPIARRFTGPGARQGTDQQSHARAGRRAAPAVESGTRCGAYSGADRGARHSAVDGGLSRGCSANLALGKLPAFEIVGAELIEAFVAARQDHYAWAGRQRDAGTQEQQ
jgi:hypothetical protein